LIVPAGDTDPPSSAFRIKVPDVAEDVTDPYIANGALACVLVVPVRTVCCEVFAVVFVP
jgi:hypothetical protein